MTTQSQMSPAAISTIQATVHAIALEPGLYAFSVVEGAGTTVVERIPVPCAHFSVAPGKSDGADVEVLNSRRGNWLIAVGDTMVVRVGGRPADLLLTIYKPVAHPDVRLLMNVTRLDAAGAPPAEITALPPPRPAVMAPPTPPAAGPTGLFGVPAAAGPMGIPGMTSAVAAGGAPKLAGGWGQRVLAAEIIAHIQNRGDVRYTDSVWVGGVGQRLAIEAFSIRVTEALRPEDIEYKALVSTGTETPWVPGGTLCGSRGMAAPLTGIAIRVRGGMADAYDCIYEASFVSGRRVGPIRNGAPCRSDMIGDSLEAFFVRIMEKGSASMSRV